MEERLHKFLANSGIASRRKCEELILAGKIRVNGKIVTELGTKINSEKDTIEFNGKIVKPSNNKIYILLNKPIGYVTTTKDQFNRDTVMDLVRGVNERLVPVGRLDMYTSGAIILTNDGNFVNKVTHPKNEIEKTYNVTVVGIVKQDEVRKLEQGVEIDTSDKEYDIKDKVNIEKNRKSNAEKEGKENKDSKYDLNKKDKKDLYKTKPAKVKILKIDEEKNLSRLQITIHEGKNREVRKMCDAINKKVLALHRAKIGNIDVKDLKLGKWRYLTAKEVESLKKN